MSLNQSLISDFSEYYRWSQRTKIKYKLHYGWCTGRRFTAFLEQEFYLRSLTLLDNVLYTDGTLEQDIAMRQISVKDPDSHSWFVACM